MHFLFVLEAKLSTQEIYAHMTEEIHKKHKHKHQEKGSHTKKSQHKHHEKKVNFYFEVKLSGVM